MLSCASALQAEELTGRQIAERVDAVDTSRDSVSQLQMVVERGGQQLVRRLEINSRHYTDVDRDLIRFLAPEDVRNVNYLTWNYKDPQRENDMWVYLPTENLVRRISGGGRKGSFMRSDLANEDMEDRQIDDDVHRLIRSEPCGGVQCRVVEMKGVDTRNSNYSRRLVWIRSDIWQPVEVHYYDQRDKHVKTARYGGFQQIDGIWSKTRAVIETLSTRSRTVLVWQKIQYNVGLPDALFEHTALKQGGGGK